MNQKHLYFFDPNGPHPTTDMVRTFLESSRCPINKLIGNERAKKRLRRAAFSGFLDATHVVRGNYALIGPASTGKTTFARVFADTLKLPFVEIQPQAVKKIQDVFGEIDKVLSRTKVPGSSDWTLELVPVKHETGNYPDPYYIVPPCVVFIDEVHNLSDAVVQGLLKATEPSDSEMVTEDGKTVNTYNVCWMIATTDRGELFDAFDTRFSKVNLRLYSKPEIAKIIQLGKPHWPLDVCALVAHYCGQVPREAQAFANDMEIEHQMYPDSWEEVAVKVATDNGIDEHGMTQQRVKILSSLGRRPISASQLSLVAGCKDEELRKYVMPVLLSTTPDRPDPLVVVSSKGYCIMPAGLAELDKRGIPHSGDEAMTVSVREMAEALTGV